MSSFEVWKDGDGKKQTNNKPSPHTEKIHQTEGRLFKSALSLTSIICKRNSFAGVDNQSFRDFQNEWSSLQDFLS